MFNVVNDQSTNVALLATVFLIQTGLVVFSSDIVQCYHCCWSFLLLAGIIFHCVIGEQYEYIQALWSTMSSLVSNTIQNLLLCMHIIVTHF